MERKDLIYFYCNNINYLCVHIDFSVSVFFALYKINNNETPKEPGSSLVIMMNKQMKLFGFIGQ